MLIPTSVFAISKFCDLESSRYALAGVKLERDRQGQPHAISTDGRRLIHVTWAEDNPAEYPAGVGATEHVENFEVIVPKSAWEEAAKFPPKRTPKPILRNVLVDEPNKNGWITLGGTDLERARTTKVRNPEGRFPSWRDCMPAAKPISQEDQEALVETFRAVRGEANPAIRVCLDVEFVKEMCDVLAKTVIDDGGNAGVDIDIPLRYGAPVLLTRKSAEGIKAEAIIMPLAADRPTKRHGKQGPKVERQPDAIDKAAELERALRCCHAWLDNLREIYGATEVADAAPGFFDRRELLQLIESITPPVVHDPELIESAEPAELLALSAPEEVAAA